MAKQIQRHRMGTAVYLGGVDPGQLDAAAADAVAASPAIARVDPGTAGSPGKALIQGPSSPTFADMETVIFDHVFERSATPATNRANFQTLLDNVAPTGTGKQVRVFLPPKFDGSGNPDPLVISGAVTGQAWGVDLPSGVTFEGAGHGSTLKLADNQINFSRLVNVTGRSRVTIRNLRLDGNKATQTAGYEQSHNLNITDSTDIVVEHVESVDAIGDDVYVGGATVPSDRIYIRHLVANGAGRNPLSVCDVNNIWIVDPDLDCSSGGQAIDSEPNMSATYRGLHIIGGKIRNSGSGAYALAISGLNETYRRTHTIVQGVEFGGGGIYMPFVEDVVIADTFGTIGKIDAKYHSRRVKMRGNVWTSTATAIAAEISATSATAYPQHWTVEGNTLIAPSATTGWQWWGGSNLMFSGNRTEGSAAMTAAFKMRPAYKNESAWTLGPNTWRTAANGVFVESPGGYTIDGFTIGSQVFHGITTRAFDFGTANYITGLSIAPQSYAGGSVGFRIGNTTSYVMGGVPGNKAVYSVYGTPEGQITDSVGAVAYRRDGGAGTTMYIKESGTGNTGWRAV